MRSLQKWENGLADRLACSISVLLYAVLTDRAFLFDNEVQVRGSQIFRYGLVWMACRQREGPEGLSDGGVSGGSCFQG